MPLKERRKGERAEDEDLAKKGEVFLDRFSALGMKYLFMPASVAEEG